MSKNMLKHALNNLPAVLYVALVYLFIFTPVAVLVLFSFQDSLLPIPPFQGPSLRWYAAVFSDFRIMDALGNSLMVAVVSAALSCLLGFLAAYGLARYTVRGSGVVQWLMVAPLSVSYLIIGMGLLVTFKTMGIPKSLLAIIIGHVVINLPLAFAIIYSQMGEHQANLERAARDLGAAEWQVLTLITLPLLWPALMAVGKNNSAQHLQLGKLKVNEVSFFGTHHRCQGRHLESNLPMIIRLPQHRIAQIGEELTISAAPEDVVLLTQ